jgi:hypothetical protein
MFLGSYRFHLARQNILAILMMIRKARMTGIGSCGNGHVFFHTKRDLSHDKGLELILVAINISKAIPIFFMMLFHSKEGCVKPVGNGKQPETSLHLGRSLEPLCHSRVLSRSCLLNRFQGVGPIHAPGALADR